MWLVLTATGRWRAATPEVRAGRRAVILGERGRWRRAGVWGALQAGLVVLLFATKDAAPTVMAIALAAAVLLLIGSAAANGMLAGMTTSCVALAIGLAIAALAVAPPGCRFARAGLPAGAQQSAPGVIAVRGNATSAQLRLASFDGINPETGICWNGDQPARLTTVRRLGRSFTIPLAVALILGLACDAARLRRVTLRQPTPAPRPVEPR